MPVPHSREELIRDCLDVRRASTTGGNGCVQSESTALERAKHYQELWRQTAE